MPTTVVNLRTAKYDVYIGRPSKWGNPFLIGPDGSRSEVLAKYLDHVLSSPLLISSLHELKDKRLGCYCHPLPCHGDILAQLVNDPPKSRPFTITSILDFFSVCCEECRKYGEQCSGKPNGCKDFQR